MTKDEFNNWKNAYFTAFPDTKAWLAKQENPAATLGTWFKCLARCNYADVALVTDKLICGELAPVDSFQREHTAIHIRAYAGRVADERNRQRRNDVERERFTNGKQAARRESGPGAASMFKQILAFREEGAALGKSGVDLNVWASERLEEWLRDNASSVSVGADDDRYAGEF